jgi:endoglucanase
MCRKGVCLIFCVLLLGIAHKAVEGAEVVMKLNRGIVIDRQFHQIPPATRVTFTATDIQLIKSMGFEFVKVIANPACFISGATINDSNMGYLDYMVNTVVNQGLPVVVCVHPEPAFKHNYLGTSDGFKNLLGFYKDFAAYMAARWDSNELAFQLMTEPFGNSPDPNEWNCWNKLQPQMWQAVRAAMPEHTLILSGDQSGIIEGLVNDVDPDLIKDNNVYYSFTTYYPYTFAFQGWKLAGAHSRWFNNVPYPSSTSNNPAQYILPECPNNLYSDVYNAVKTYCNTPWDMNQQRAILKPITDWNNAHGGKLKIWCAEWGALDRQMASEGGGCNPSDRIQFIHDRRQAFEEINIGWAYWSYNEAFTVLDPNLRVHNSNSPSYNWVDKEMLHALGLLGSQGNAKVD